MARILEGLRVIEASAFVAAPLAGMTLAQMGADVIRFDRIGGGLDHGRWPVTAQGKSLFWAGMNKGKRSLAIDISKPEGKEIVTRLICAPGADRGIFLTNLRARGWLDYDEPVDCRLEQISAVAERLGDPRAVVEPDDRRLVVAAGSGLIDIDDQITSICFEVSAGMMPSHATSTSSHFSFICAQTAFMRSISQPTQVPEASFDEKGG